MASRPKRVPIHQQVKETRGTSNQNAIIVLLKTARKSGSLNLSNRSLEEVPENVWLLNREVPGGGKSLSMDDTGDCWWDQVDLTKLILGYNCLRSISKDISNFTALSHLDLRDNKLESLPDDVRSLTELQWLNISQNLFKEIPQCVFKLTKLRFFHARGNIILDIPDSVGNLNCLDELDLSENKLSYLPDDIKHLTKLRELNISVNSISRVPPGIGDLKCLRNLDLSQNNISHVPDEIGQLSNLDRLCLQVNQLENFPKLEKCSVLKELYLGNNLITKIPPDCLQPMTSLVILDLRDNKLKTIPDEILILHHLERFNLTNNDLSNLPNVLGTMGNLKSLLVEGNPLRSIRRDLISRGTMELKKYLVTRMSPAELSSMPCLGIASDAPSSTFVPPTSSAGAADINLDFSKSLDLSGKRLNEVPDDLFPLAVTRGVKEINVSKNLLTSFPSGLLEVSKTLTELNLSFNRLSELHSDVGKLDRLVILSLSNNLLTQLPSDLALLKSLREIYISFNRFTVLPEVLYDLENLETILISDNKVERFDAKKICHLSKLTTLDLQNNNIAFLDPLLGRCTQLRHCKLEGNQFRYPQPSILSKGTEALLEFLRDQIPE